MHDYAQNKRIFWSRKILEFFIQLYKKQNCLYDVNHEDFSSRTRRNAALEFILQKIQTFLPDIQLEDVRSKINAMRTQIANEFNMIEEAAASDMEYVPKLWCFEQLKFLQPHLTTTLPAETVEKTEYPMWEEDTSTYVNDYSDDSDDTNSLYTEINQNTPQRKFCWTRDDTAIFIKLFKRHQLLWDPNHILYKNRDKREEARNKLLLEMKRYDPNITLHDVCEKIKCIRCQYTRELRHIEKAEKAEKSYVPKLWCFEELSYLKNASIKGYNKRTTDYDDETRTGHVNNITNNSEETTFNNDNATNNNIMDEIHIEQIMNEDEVEYDENVLTSHENSIIEIIQNDKVIENVDDNDYMTEGDHNQEHLSQPSAKKSRFEETSDNNEKNSKLLITKLVTSESKKGTKRIAPTNTQDEKFEWLGELVVGQMNDISPTFRADFAWDVQCLIRKYILKTKGEKSGEQSSSSKDTQNKNLFNDIVLPRSSNISLNISFL